MSSTVKSFLAAGGLVAASALLAVVAQAQVYRIVGPDGKVTFSDKAPPAAANAKVTEVGGSSGGVAASSLPFELRQVAGKYPVTLYTGDNCSPCGAARAHLTTRGIPFSEKTVTTDADSKALQRLSGESMLPFATIGSQQLKGFADSEWTQFLNAAGYPATSVLPPSYRPPAATPLVAAEAAPASTPTGTGPAIARPAAPVQPAPAANNPAGIRF